jgi:hypothetical protein
MIPSAFIFLYENNHGSSEVTHFNFMSSWIDKASWLGWFASGESVSKLIFFLQDDGQPMTSRCYSATSI